MKAHVTEREMVALFHEIEIIIGYMRLSVKATVWFTQR